MRVDATLLAEVLFSLIDNAAKYSPAGSRIGITAERASEDEMILMAITDEGPGVTPELRERVSEIPLDKPILVHCAGGYRSSAGSSIIEKELGVTALDLSDDIKKFEKVKSH